ALARRVIDSLQGAGLATRALVPRQRTAWALNWRTAELAKQGASRAQAERALRSALGGHTLGHLDLPGGEIDVHLEANRTQRLGQLSLGPEGNVSLSSVAELELVERKPPWLRSDGRPARFLQTQTVEDSSTLRGTLANLALAEDEDLRRGGAAAEIDRSFAQLRTTLLLGSLLVFLTVAALYESLALPFAVGATIPLAAAGSLLALWLTGQSLNVLSFLGVILLSGIVVNNSIVLLSRLEELRTRAGREVPLREEDSRSAQHLVLEAASARYRPIVMTTTTTVLSMLPLVVIPGQGIELRRSLGLAVLGGLISGAFASLFIVPTVHLALFPGLPSRGRSQAGAEDRETETR
ncbi:MAG: efflux RND transporter permease subunit, partial [Acidobacteriota bacterium]